MTAVAILATMLALVIVLCEIVLGGRKLQTALLRLLPAYGVMALASIAYLAPVHRIHVVTLIIFWAGAFLTWFGVRSHIESSILLRMVSLLGQRAMSRPELLGRYEEEYGELARRNELVRAGLVVIGPDGVALTRKGRAVHRVARALTGSPAVSRTCGAADSGELPTAGPPGLRSTERVALLVLLVFSLAMNTVGITWGLPAFDSWSNDDLTPLSPLVAVHGRFAVPTKYPPAHHAILALADSPYLGYLYLTGQFRGPSSQFPYGFSEPLTALTTLMLIGRGVSALMGVGVVYLVYRATRIMTGDPRAALLAACVIAFNTEFVLFAHLGNTDVPALFWLAAALVCFARLRAQWRSGDGALLGLTAALAIATKDTSYAAVGGMALVLVVSGLGDRRSVRPLATGLGAFVVAYALASNWVWGWSAYVARVKSLVAASAQEHLQVSATLSGQLILLRHSFVQLADIMGWPMFLAMAIGLLLVWRHQWRLALSLLVPSVIYYVGSIAIVRFVFPRYLLPVVMFLAPVTGLALAGHRGGGHHRQGRRDDSDARGSWRRFRTPVVAAVLAFSFVWAARADSRLLSDIRYQAEDYLRHHLPRAASVEVYSSSTYLPRLRELGFTVRHVRPGPAADEVYSGSALAARDPDAIVLTSKGSASGSRHRQYLDDLLGGRLGYRATVFPGLDSPRGPEAQDSDEYVSRVSPTIWILERDRAPRARMDSPPEDTADRVQSRIRPEALSSRQRHATRAA